MIFQQSITIPPNTPESNPTIVMMPVEYGIITEIKVRPKKGHAHLAHLIILHNEHQIAPSMTNMSFSGDTFPIDFGEHYEVYQPEFELKLIGWNFDDSYRHTFNVFVVVLSPEATLAYQITTAIGNFFKMLNPLRIFTGGD